MKRISRKKIKRKIKIISTHHLLFAVSTSIIELNDFENHKKNKKHSVVKVKINIKISLKFKCYDVNNIG